MAHSSESSQISRIRAREVFDSRGQPTVEVEVTCGPGKAGRAIAPSGASKGRFEALELRDGDPARLGGAGVLRAVDHVNTLIARALIGVDAADQPAVDVRLRELDGDPNFARLGANAVVAVSLASAHAAAAACGVELVEHLHALWLQTSSRAAADPPLSPANADSAGTIIPHLGTALVLPVPMVNMISGGLHAGGNLDFQDFLILPIGAGSFRQALEWVIAVYHRLGDLLHTLGFDGTLVGDEGGYGPRLKSNRQALEILTRAIDECGFIPGRGVGIGLDVAATHLTCPQGYALSRNPETETLSSQAMI